MEAKQNNLLREKIIIGLEKAYKKLIEFKKEKKSNLIISEGNKIVFIKPEDL